MNNESSWIKYIKGRIRDNKNFLAMFTGPTGSGKSLSALTVLKMLNDEFDMEMVVFSGKDLMRLINSKKYEDKKGKVIGFLWDEAGIDLGNRQWQSITNRVINFLLQTFRHRNFVLFFTAPYMDFVDSSTRKLFHATFETCGINKTNQTVSVKPKQIQYNADRKKFYYHYLKVMKPGSGMVKIKRWSIPRVTREDENFYEKKKIEFTSKLNKEIGETLESLDSNGKRRKKLTPRQELIKEAEEAGCKTQKEKAEYVSEREGTTVTQPNICLNLQYMASKGY